MAAVGLGVTPGGARPGGARLKWLIPCSSSSHKPLIHPKSTPNGAFLPPPPVNQSRSRRLQAGQLEGGVAQGQKRQARRGQRIQSYFGKDVCNCGQGTSGRGKKGKISRRDATQDLLWTSVPWAEATRLPSHRRSATAGRAGSLVQITNTKVGGGWGGCALAVVGRRVAAETAALLGRRARGMQPDFGRDVGMAAKEPKKSVPVGGGTSALTPALSPRRGRMVVRLMTITAPNHIRM